MFTDDAVGQPFAHAAGSLVDDTVLGTPAFAEEEEELTEQPPADESPQSIRNQDVGEKPPLDGLRSPIEEEDVADQPRPDERPPPLKEEEITDERPPDERPPPIEEDGEEVADEATPDDADATFVTGVDQIPLYDGNSNQLQSTELLPELVEALTSLLRSESIPVPHMRAAVVRLANVRKLEALMASQYRGASQYEKALSLMRRRIATDEAQEVTKRKLAARREFLESRRVWLNEEYGMRLERARELNAGRYDEILARHRFELEQFKAKWQDPEFLRQFNHPSSKLLELRNLEKKFALMRSYDNAKQMKATADRLQAREEGAMQDHIDTVMRREFARLREQQKSEAEKMIAHDDKVLESLERQRQSELVPLKAAAKRLLAVKQTTRMRPVGLLAKGQIAATSPRMRARFLRYRDTASAALRIDPPDDATFDRLTTRKAGRS
jgi:hypothetical protein